MAVSAMVVCSPVARSMSISRAGGNQLGISDWIFRLGLVLLYLAFTGQYTPWTWIGVVPLLTGLLGSCPLYSVLGINTCKVK